MSTTTIRSSITSGPARPAIADPHPVGRVRKARAEEVTALAQVLARAFEDDPVSKWVFPDERNRLRGLEQMFRLINVPDALGDDEAYTTDDHAGVALWVPAGKGKPGLVENLRLISTAVRIWGRHTPRALRVLSYMESKFPERPHAHLVFIGTEPERQGQGVGGVLLRRTLPRLDREGVPAYLEASTLRSRELYLRHGFVDIDEMRLPGGGPTLWRMWREPAR
jgi:GNAT superfamily N-acetyltransferase